VGAALVLLGLPALYARLAGPLGSLGLVGVVLVALAWMFFGVFLSLYAVLIAPWLADEAPWSVRTCHGCIVRPRDKSLLAGSWRPRLIHSHETFAGLARPAPGRPRATRSDRAAPPR
jgi:hypothetical protein